MMFCDRSMLENNPHLTRQEIAEEFGIHYTTVGDHIKSLGRPSQHELTENNLSDRVRMCSSQLIRYNVEPFLEKLITGDKKWNQLEKLNAAIKEKRPTLASRKGIVFHHDNARPHTAMVTQQKLNALGWEVLGHPLYSPDMAPSDYYLFRSLQNYLTKKNSNLLKVFGRQLLTILSPRTRTSAK
ncbi:histone-lysine N-methyltransferase SETMAR [Trichonephila clavipes]|nr:histone-lysine N-methyltransferase SETMAR [Trichonephila clavipes]